MGITRRDFCKEVLLAGGTLLVGGGVSVPSAGAAEERPAGYCDLERRGELSARVGRAYALMEACRLCPRECGCNRLRGERGFCRAPLRAVVYGAHPHFGEEIPLVGRHGSGTIFFSHCNLRCVFCQNWPISHQGLGDELADEEVAGLMLRLQEIGCHNINLVTPTHVMPNILGAVRAACRRGLTVPLVYNTSGYERLETLRMLDGIVDIYLPDMKYSDPAKAAAYSAGASDYPEVARKAILEMHRQVGVLEVDGRGVARHGLMIRHLVMPNRVAGTEEFLRWLSSALPKTTYLNIMAQYHVDYQAYDHQEIARGISVGEYLEAMDWAERHGFSNLDERSLKVRDMYRKQR